MINNDLADNKSKSSTYRPPQLFVVGTAVKLVRGSYTGHLRDGSGGWWLYCG